MNLSESVAVKQRSSETQNANLARDFRQAIQVINGDYQQIDWEDRTFLNRVLKDALKNLEVKEGSQNNG